MTRKEILQRLHHKSSRTLFESVISVGLFFGLLAVTLFAWANGYWPLVLISWLLQAHIGHTNLLAFHEASHYTLHPNRRVNELQGVILGSVILTPLSAYRWVHNQHHIHLGTPRDAELWPFVDPTAKRWRRVLTALPKYRAHVWEPRPKDPRLPLGSFDGYADAIESALYLVNREPVPEALDWIETETARMLAMQRPDGHLEDWYGEGNFNRTLLLYALMKSQGVMPAAKAPGLAIGAMRDGQTLRLHVAGVQRVTLQFDTARHRRVLNFSRNYVRLNEFPEWYTVDPTWLYRLSGPDGTARVRLGAELVRGEPFTAGAWTIAPVGPPPYGSRQVP